VTTYQVQAFDANGNSLDIDPQGRREGWPLLGLSVREALEVARTLRTGLELNFDEPSASRPKRIAWLRLILPTGHAEVYVTPWGYHCNVTREINEHTFAQRERVSPDRIYSATF